MPDIYCSVDNCHYWKNGNVCYANQIMVTSDTMGASQPDSFDAPEHKQFQGTPVNQCMDTCCKTFVEKGSGRVKEDGVTKR
ncbi:MAG: DUF1540 domain-containing protein [Eubacteriales bacterium]